MQLLTTPEAKQWCQSRGLTGGETGRANEWRFARDAQPDLEFTTDRRPPELVSLASACLLVGTQGGDDPDFAGALVWLLDWDIWGETSERIAVFLSQKVRGDTESRSSGALRERPATLFSPGELVEAQALVSIPMLFQWDALVVPEPARAAAVISHHGGVLLKSASRVVYEQLSYRFEEGRS
jgi:hypothetical protein